MASTDAIDVPASADDTYQAPDQETAPCGDSASLPRRMPDDVRKRLIRLRDGKQYLPAAFRVVWFRDDHPDWSIVTDIIEGGYEAGWATVKASILTPDGRIVATGMKTESKSDFPAGWVEKAETGAIGRALALAGYGTQFAPDLDEDARAPDAGRSGATAADGKATSSQRRHSPAPTVWQGPGLCPKCHAPAGKPHARTCTA